MYKFKYLWWVLYFCLNPEKIKQKKNKPTTKKKIGADLLDHLFIPSRPKQNINQDNSLLHLKTHAARCSWNQKALRVKYKTLLLKFLKTLSK